MRCAGKRRTRRHTCCSGAPACRAYVCACLKTSTQTRHSCEMAGPWRPWSAAIYTESSWAAAGGRLARGESTTPRKTTRPMFGRRGFRPVPQSARDTKPKPVHHSLVFRDYNKSETCSDGVNLQPIYEVISTYFSRLSLC